MATISLCMIVKNEEKLLERCLDSICDLVDEIVIVDTGSTDSTISIARNYTDMIYNFNWIDDFSAARNFSFSKCNMDYIYVADADEYLDETNRLQFKILKENLDSQIEIVQMMYNTVSHDTVLNIRKEYRPKLFKRLRSFTWINPIHETVRLDPLVFDSDIIITHAPDGNHSSRDFQVFEKTIESNGFLSDNLTKMYATELYKNGSAKNIDNSIPFFMKLLQIENITDLINRENFYIEDVYAIIILCKSLRLSNYKNFESLFLTLLEKTEWPSEVCYELGEYYMEKGMYEEALDIFIMAYQSISYLDIHAGGDNPLRRIIECLDYLITNCKAHSSESIQNKENESMISEYTDLLNNYKTELTNWEMPEESLV